MKITAAQIKKFQTRIWHFYNTHKRDFVWRKKITPYFVVVSEIMLQQTQTVRVAEKFPEFIKRFSTFKALSEASTAEVILAWQGLGYNRRALFLRELSKKIVNKYNGKLPQNPEELITLPGIGKNTAGSIMAFAFNKPVVFIETNLRSVYLHEFFPGKTEVSDTELLPLIEATVSKDQPREWYYALMDYGVMLKKENKNPSRASKHHHKQSVFKGSQRAVRGEILRVLAQKPNTLLELKKHINHFDPQYTSQTTQILATLTAEGFIEKNHTHYCLKTS